MKERRPTSDYRIGCAGWYYPHWRGPFYPDGLPAHGWLDFYARHFDTVEINSSFYRLPGEKALYTWQERTPSGFCFASKASRLITHRKKLSAAEGALAVFLGRMEILGGKLGPFLFQLPPHWRRNAQRLDRFLNDLPPGHRYAFEMRDPSWHHPEVYALLRAHNAAFCIFDLAGFQSPLELTADFTYLRLHGPGAVAYAGCYGTDALSIWAARIRSWRDLSAVHVYFNNDQAAYATRNALELKSILALSMDEGGRAGG
ncbi:MAG: DUF72 domain-containing protein [Gammaproteobacteria bacterium]|jgi:uncharacterized protein YecE (DUF72 family)|nr:DUF72 domain-containing protein [Gammaproteobacteria bacterium]